MAGILCWLMSTAELVYKTGRKCVTGHLVSEESFSLAAQVSFTTAPISTFVVALYFQDE